MRIRNSGGFCFWGSLGCGLAFLLGTGCAAGNAGPSSGRDEARTASGSSATTTETTENAAADLVSVDSASKDSKNSKKATCDKHGRCQHGEVCVDGLCASCNPNILFLSDGAVWVDGSHPDDRSVAAMTAAGLVPTLVTPVHSYTGTPDPAGFGAVIVAVGNDTDHDMPVEGQTAIVNAFNAGTGTVFTEFLVYETNVLVQHYQTLKPLFLTTYSGFAGGPETYTLTSPGHPLWTGLPTSFTSSISLFSLAGSIVNGGTQIATGLAGTATNGIVVKDAAGGSGRTVQIDHSANYEIFWNTDANLVKMFANSAAWAAGCL